MINTKEVLTEKMTLKLPLTEQQDESFKVQVIIKVIIHLGTKLANKYLSSCILAISAHAGEMFKERQTENYSCNLKLLSKVTKKDI